METMIVYVDEAAYALRMLTPMMGSDRQRLPMRWIVVCCPPRMSRHIGKWVTNSSRQSWRGEWARKLTGEISPLLQAAGDSFTSEVARSPLCELTDTLLARHRGARVIDARRPKFGHDLAPVTRQQRQEPQGVYGYIAAAAGAVLLIAAD
jgi:hypothetical protein